MIGNIFKYIITTTKSLRFNKSSKVFVLSLLLIVGTLSAWVPVREVEAQGGGGSVASAYSGGSANPTTGGSSVATASSPIAVNGDNPNCNMNPNTWVNCFLAYLAQTVLEIAAWFLMISAMFFNALIDMTLNIKDFITKVPIVNLGWATFRDFTNIFFIFIILYIAINTIMGNEGYGIKKLLGKTIITAILINFSLFFTQVVVDASNIIALQFYAKITENIKNGESTSSTKNSTETSDGGISAAFVKAVGLQKIYTSNGSTDSAAAAAKGVTTSYMSASNGNHWYNIIIVGLGGTAFILITSFVLVAGAFMLLIRTLTLMFLMILSPLAFLGGILPSTQGYVKQWWDTLIKNALFAPAYMALLYLVASMVLKTTGSSLNSDNANFTDMLLGNANTNWIGVLTNYVILNALMIGCLVLASKLGAGGSSMAMKLGKNIGNGAMGYVGRGVGGATFGMGARAGRRVFGGMADIAQERLRDSRFATTFAGRKTMGALKSVASASFDARNVAGMGKTLGIGSGATGGFKESREAKQKGLVEYGKTLTKNKVTGYDAKDDFAEKQFGKKTMFGLIQRGNKLAGAELKISAIDDRIKDEYTERISEISSLITTYENTPAYKKYNKLEEKVEKQQDKVDGMSPTDPKYATELSNLTRLRAQLAVAQADPALTRTVSYKDANGGNMTTTAADISDRLKEVRTELTDAKKVVESSKKPYKDQSKSSGINLPRRY